MALSDCGRDLVSWDDQPTPLTAPQQSLAVDTSAQQSCSADVVESPGTLHAFDRQLEQSLAAAEKCSEMETQIVQDRNDELKTERLLPMVITFTEKWTDSDVSFVVEERLIYAVRNILSMWSPIFRQMFNGLSLQEDAPVIPLPGKNFNEILELITILHPPGKPIDESNVYYILPLVREFGINGLMPRIEEFLTNTDLSVAHFVLTDEYGFDELYKRVSLKKLQKEKSFENVKPEVLDKLYKDRACSYEKILYGLCNNVFGELCGWTDFCVHAGPDFNRYSSRRVCVKCTKYLKEMNESFNTIGIAANEEMWKSSSMDY